MVAYYRHDIAAWMDGTESLSDGEYRVYHVICELIYFHEGPIVANEKGLAGRCNQHILRFRQNLAKLIAKCKITLVDGKLMNGRAASEIERLHRANPPRTPRQPLSNPPATLEQPPGGLPRKPLKIKRAVRDPKKPLVESLSSSFSDSLFLEDSRVSEERSSGRGWDFEEFWRQYPHKVGKRDAVKAFEAARKRGAAFIDVMAGLLRYAEKTDDRPWCNPATFLNQERWLDEPARNNGGGKHDSIIDAIDRVFGPDEGTDDQALRPHPIRRLPQGSVRGP